MQLVNNTWIQKGGQQIMISARIDKGYYRKLVWGRSVLWMDKST